MLDRRATLILAGMAYLALVAWSYSQIIAPGWGYTGLVDRPSADGSLVFAYSLAALPLAFLPIRLERPSHGILWLLYLFLYVPSSVVPYYVLGAGFSIAPVSMTLVAGFFIVLAMERLPRSDLAGPLTSYSVYLPGLATLAGVAVAYQAATLGLSLDLPALSDVYDVRAEYAERLDDATRLVAYVVGWTSAAVGPTLMVMGLVRRRIGYAALGAAVQVLVYGLTGSKIAILSSVLLVALIAAYSASQRARGGLILIAGLASTLGVILIWEGLFGGNLLSSLFIRRLIMIPGWAFAVYTDFFSSHPTYQLSHSVLGWAFERPYQLNPAQLVGYAYQGRIYSANAGVWSDGMANFGTAGVVGFSLLIGILMWIIDSVASRRPLALAGPILGVACFSLVNSALLTSIATHGIAIAILLVWLMPRYRLDDLRATEAGATLEYAIRANGVPTPTVVARPEERVQFSR